MSSAPVWIFDLDNTLHDAGPHIFPHINRSMTAYVARTLSLTDEEASALRASYWRKYGATLLGMMRHHGTDPRHFLWNTHQFPDLPRMVVSKPQLAGMLRRLPGRKVLFSNAPAHYAVAVLRAMGIGQFFDEVFAIERMRFRPKPGREPFLRVIRALRVPARRCVMIEDSAENLRTARQLGMKTVWISRMARCPAWVDLRLQSVIELPRKLGQLSLR